MDDDAAFILFLRGVYVSYKPVFLLIQLPTTATQLQIGGSHRATASLGENQHSPVRTHLAASWQQQAGHAAVDARGGAVGFLRDVAADDGVFLRKHGRRQSRRVSSLPHNPQPPPR